MTNVFGCRISSIPQRVRKSLKSFCMILGITVAILAFPVLLIVGICYDLKAEKTNFAGLEYNIGDRVELIDGTIAVIWYKKANSREGWYNCTIPGISIEMITVEPAHIRGVAKD